jgi:oligopeptide transport system substrate-binding protein
MVWTFKIREGGKWVNSKGEVIGEVTANDFAFGFSELLNPANAAEYYYFATVFKNAQAYYDYVSGVEGAPEVTLEEVGIKVLDDYTLQLELENYLPYFLQYLKFEVMAPVYEPFYTEVGADNYGTSPETLAFNGPFYMTEWILENTITTVKNPEWHDADKVNLAKINWVKFTDSNVKYNAFLGGEMDLIDITGEQRAMFEAEDFTPSAYEGGYSFYFWVNTTDTSDMRSPSLRKAVSAAIDRRQIIDTVFKNDNLVPPAFTFGITGVNTPSFADAVVAANGGEPMYSATADVESAKTYLAAALEELGYTDASEVKLSIMTSEGTQNELMSQVVQEQLRVALGINCEIEVLTITEWRARRNVIDFDICHGGWGPDYNDPMTDLDLFETGNGNNHTGYSNPEYDALLAQARLEVDMEAREKLFIQLEFMLKEDAPIIPTYWRAEDFIVSEKMVEGYSRMPFVAYNFIYTVLAD